LGEICFYLLISFTRLFCRVRQTAIDNASIKKQLNKTVSFPNEIYTMKIKVFKKQIHTIENF